MTDAFRVWEKMLDGVFDGLETMKGNEGDGEEEGDDDGFMLCLRDGELPYSRSGYFGLLRWVRKSFAVKF